MGVRDDSSLEIAPVPLTAERMPHETTLHIVDGDVRMTLPEDVVDHMRLRDGERVHLIETSQGVLLVPYDDDFADAMQIYEEGVSTYEEALQSLTDRRPT